MVVRSAVGTIPFTRVEITEQARTAAAEVLASGWITSGDEVLRFEEEFADWTETVYAVAVSSCTAALEISLRSLRLRPGSKVLVPTMTFCGAAHAIVNAGLQPVLVDVDPSTLLATEATVAAASHRAGGVDAMMVLHFAGYPAPVEALALAAGLPLSRVIEDAAHAVGAASSCRKVGGISAATCFSFYATKNLPIGEGGMITTDDRELAAYARKARLHGMSTDAWRRYLPTNSSWRYQVDVAGIKANMTDIQAAIGRNQLRYLEAWQQRRAQITSRYTRALTGIKGLQLPAWPSSGRHAWHPYVVQVNPLLGVDRDEFIEYLQRAGISCSVHFIPLHQHTYFRRLAQTGPTEWPGADHAADRIVSLPLYPSLTNEEVDHVCDAIEKIAYASQPIPARTHERVATS
jgi:perosamine synthetase